MHPFAKALHVAQQHLNLYPFIETAKLQTYVLRKCNFHLDGRTIAGMRAILHRNMVRKAA
jgi:hypothetical protein